MVPIDNQTFEQLSQYAALLKDRDTDKAAVLRVTIMRERNWNDHHWAYARDSWLLMLRGKLDDLNGEEIRRALLSREDSDDDEWPRPPNDENPEIARLSRLIENEEGHPVAMSLAETAFLLDGIRNPGLMRHVVEKHLGEVVYGLRKNEFDGCAPYEEIYVENSVVGLVTVLRPMLLDTVNSFFGLTDAERAQLKANRDNLRREIHEAMLSDPEMAEDTGYNWNPPPTEFDLSWGPFYEAIVRLDIDQRHQLAVEFLNRPEVMVRDALAAEVLREVLFLMPGSEINDLPRTEWGVWSVVINAPGCSNLLPMLRDLRRALGG
jgi:hypothetical protein